MWEEPRWDGYSSYSGYSGGEPATGAGKKAIGKKSNAEVALYQITSHRDTECSLCKIYSMEMRYDHYILFQVIKCCYGVAKNFQSYTINEYLLLAAIVMCIYT